MTPLPPPRHSKATFILQMSQSILNFDLFIFFYSDLYLTNNLFLQIFNHMLNQTIFILESCLSEEGDFTF